MGLPIEVREMIDDLSGKNGPQNQINAGIEISLKMQMFKHQEETIKLMAAKIRRLEGGYDPHAGDEIEFVPDDEFFEPDNYIETTITSFGKTRKGTPIKVPR